MEKYILSLDQGTTSSRAILFDSQGQIVSSAQQEFTQIYPNPGWVEHDPTEIWATEAGVAVEAAVKAHVGADEIAAIGITNQRETTIVWNRKTGKPVYNAIVWQCRRTSGIIDALTESEKTEIRRKTGLIPDAYFSATKIKWILDNVPGTRELAEKGELLFGTVDCWLLWNLTGGKVHATDYTNASRTMLFNIKELKWDKELLEKFGIPESMMPQVHPSGYDFGMTDEGLFGKRIKISGIAGDQQSSLFGLGCHEKGDVKNTYGTGCFLLMNTGKVPVMSENGLLTTVAAGFDGAPDYALEGSVFMGGAVLKWLKDELGLLKKASESEAAALSVPDTAGVYLVPAFTGLGAPYWNQDARGLMVGMTRGFNRNHFIRTALESIAYQTCDVLTAMEADSGLKVGIMKADGGASANNFLMQFQSDITATKIMRPEMLENTAFGAACLAGLTCGFWKSKNDIKCFSGGRTFEPCMTAQARNEKLAGWKNAVKLCCKGASNE